MSQPKQIDFSQPWSVEEGASAFGIKNNGHWWAVSYYRDQAEQICSALNHLRALRSEIGSFLEQTKVDREESVAKG